MWKRNIFRRWQKTGSEGDGWTSTDSVFQSVAAATGKEGGGTLCGQEEKEDGGKKFSNTFGSLYYGDHVVAETPALS